MIRNSLYRMFSNNSLSLSADSQEMEEESGLRSSAESSTVQKKRVLRQARLGSEALCDVTKGADSSNESLANIPPQVMSPPTSSHVLSNMQRVHQSSRKLSLFLFKETSKQTEDNIQHVFSVGPSLFVFFFLTRNSAPLKSRWEK